MERIYLNKVRDFLGQKIKVCGFVNSFRDHGKVFFVDLKDITGILQLVFNINENNEKEIKKIRNQFVLEVEGILKERPEKMKNPKIETGDLELVVENFKILSLAKPLPFSVDDDGYSISEDLRMKYRYLDLRRERLKRNLFLRQKIISFFRNFLQKENFLEIETPILTKSTPEGARDFLVPSRLYPGKFYALPQSPQQYKQLLMVAGFEKYFQVARCFRDEDPRADRQPEFTQLDIEASFFSQEEILNLVERMIVSLVKELFPSKKITFMPFLRLPYREAMEKYNSDKPDLRKNKEDPNELAFLFIVDFPMFEWKETEKRWDAVHHPFTLPQEKNIEKIKKNPEEILAYQYDIVLNGFEVGGGSLRTTDIDLLTAVFEVMGHKREDFQKKFSHLLTAFEYGVPPHGGIALGLERLISLLLGEKNIREVIAFPKTGDSRDLMMDVPDLVSKEQLEELHLEIKNKKEKK